MAIQPITSPVRDRLGNLFDKVNLQSSLETEDPWEVYTWGSESDDQIHELFFTVHQVSVQAVSEDENEGEISANPEVEKELDFPTNLNFISADDSVALYLKEMSRVPLLSTEEEINLAQRIERAYLAKRELKKLSRRNGYKRRIDLEALIQDGVDAREHLIKANTRLVVSIAKKYIGRGVPFLDLIQEGNLGLMKAVSKFEYQRGFRFSTYATWWIRQTITRSIADQGRTIRIPVHMTDRIRLLYKTAHHLEQSLGRPPTTEEMAVEMGVTLDKIHWMLEVSRTPISLESPVGDDEDSELGMFVEDEISPSPSQTAYENMLRDRIEQVLATLTPREARILRLRFGLENGHPYTLEEVGHKFGLTRERIRQIEGKALRRLRHPCRSRLLKEYL